MENFLNFSRSFVDVTDMRNELMYRPIVDLADYAIRLNRYQDTNLVMVNSLPPNTPMYDIAKAKLSDCTNQLSLVLLVLGEKIGVDNSR